MLKQGIIEPSRGDWASNIVLVQKKDGAFRFCVDFRAVNLKCKKEVYPIPRIDTSLDALAGSSWFSTLDLRSGYFQVLLDPEDLHKSSFITRSGCWKFKVLPMGMCNSSATFQRLMNLVLDGLTYSSCLVYLDDIVIMSSTIDEHYQRLGQVFERIRAAKLKLRPDKCRILQREIDFLGHVVSGDGIRMDSRKIEVVRDWPRPKNLREVRSFLGLCAYYRKFVQGFSALASPLHALTRKYARFDWSDTCQKAFETLKEKMLTAPVMSLPRDEGEYTLDTDASGWAIGAVLSQQQDGHERVIAYGSRLYSRAESRYDTTRQELLAVVYFVQYYKQYLLGRHFKIRTDHAALQWLLRTPEPIGQQSRWVEQLSACDFEIIHRAGGSHQNADAVSRWPYEPRGQVLDQEDVRQVAPVKLEVVDVWSSANLQLKQEEDSGIREIKRLLENFPDRRPLWSELEGLPEDTEEMEGDDRDVPANQCLSCMKSFTRPAGLRQHVESVHQNLVWFCPLCSVWQCSRSNITRHFRRQHKEVAHPPEPVKGPRPPKLPSEGTMEDPIGNVRQVRVGPPMNEGKFKERVGSDHEESTSGETTEDEASWNRGSDSTSQVTRMRFSPLTGTLSESDRLLRMGVIAGWARRMKSAAEDDDRESWAQDFATEASVSVSLARVLVEAFMEMREVVKEPDGEQMSPAGMPATAPEDVLETTSVCSTLTPEELICADLIQTPLAATIQSALNLVNENRIDSFVGVYEDISSVEPTDGSSSGESSGKNSLVGEMSFSGYRSMLDFSLGFTRQPEDRPMDGMEIRNEEDEEQELLSL